MSGRGAFSHYATLGAKKTDDAKRVESRDSSDQAVYMEFARRLQALMLKKTFNQAQLARRCTALIPKPPKGQKRMKDVERSLISGYVRGIHLPDSIRLDLLARALECEPEDLLPPGSVPSAETKRPKLFVMDDAGDGRVHFKINRTLSMETATKIVALLKKEDRL